MGKYISSAILIVMIAFILNFFNIIHISFLDLPDVDEENRISLKRSVTVISSLD